MMWQTDRQTNIETTSHFRRWNLFDVSCQRNISVCVWCKSIHF